MCTSVTVNFRIVVVIMILLDVVLEMMGVRDVRMTKVNVEVMSVTGGKTFVFRLIGVRFRHTEPSTYGGKNEERTVTLPCNTAAILYWNLWTMLDRYKTEQDFNRPRSTHA